MALGTGDRRGVSEVASAIGAGGMGEVSKAGDTKLDRDVALKIRPDAFVNVRELIRELLDPHGESIRWTDASFLDTSVSLPLP